MSNSTNNTQAASSNGVVTNVSSAPATARVVAFGGLGVMDMLSSILMRAVSLGWQTASEVAQGRATMTNAAAASTILAGQANANSALAEAGASMAGAVGGVVSMTGSAAAFSAHQEAADIAGQRSTLAGYSTAAAASSRPPATNQPDTRTQLRDWVTGDGKGLAPTTNRYMQDEVQSLQAELTRDHTLASARADRASTMSTGLTAAFTSTANATAGMAKSSNTLAASTNDAAATIQRGMAETLGDINSQARQSMQGLLQAVQGLQQQEAQAKQAMASAR